MTNTYHAQPFDHLFSSFNTLGAANLQLTRLRICNCLYMYVIYTMLISLFFLISLIHCFTRPSFDSSQSGFFSFTLSSSSSPPFITLLEETFTLTDSIQVLNLLWIIVYWGNI
ncbi:hypothetical protein Hanom_Chr03g00196411 [Helianthus anomalus]